LLSKIRAIREGAARADHGHPEIVELLLVRPENSDWILASSKRTRALAQTIGAKALVRAPGGHAHALQVSEEFVAAVEEQEARSAEARLLSPDEGDEAQLLRDVMLVLKHHPSRALAWVRRRETRLGRFGMDLGYSEGAKIAAAIVRTPALKTSDKRAALQKLIEDAEDPWIRIGATVYLRMLDPSSGKHALEELAVPSIGPAHYWAALALARCGERSAWNTLVALLAEPRDHVSIDGWVMANLQEERTVELLSNSAAAEGLPNPVSEEDMDRDLAHAQASIS
jgi:hypothetical protein